MSKLTVSIPDDLHQKIREELEKQGITTSQFISLVAFVSGSAYGIFFAANAPRSDTITVQQAVETLTAEYRDRLEEISDTVQHDRQDITTNDDVYYIRWQDVLAVFSSYVAGSEQGAPVAALTEEQVDKLRGIMWAMNAVDYSTHTEITTIETTGEEGQPTTTNITETVLVIELTHKTPDEMASDYHFTNRQNTYLQLLQDPQYEELWAELLGGFEQGSGKLMAPDDTLTPTGTLQWPLPVAGTITSQFGHRVDPITGEVSSHTGTDIACAEGPPILAAADGTVTVANGLDSWGGTIYHKTEYRERRNHYAFFTVNAPIDGFDTSREAFLGGWRSNANPEVVEKGACTNSVAHGWSPVGVHQVNVTLQPGEHRSLIFVLGYIENPENEKWAAPGVINKTRAQKLMARYATDAQVDEALAKLHAHWNNLLSTYSVKSGDEKLDRMVNIWNQYQCMVTFNMSRSASYYESGTGRGMGFRDSCQDLLGFVHLIPARARERILDIAATQFPDGSAYHQYQPLTKKGNMDIGSGFNDDPLWLIAAVYAYLGETGDYSILDESVDFDNDHSLAQPLLEHLRRSFGYLRDHKGPHGLPLIGRADWNDCLNLNCFSKTPGESFQTTGPSEGPVAESVFIAGMYVKYGNQFAEILDSTGHADEAAAVREETAAMEHAALTAGWDGKWFRRAYDAYGHVVGGEECDEGKIFIEPQGMCVMAGIGTKTGEAVTALQSVKDKLDTKYGIVLLQPAYTKYHLELGEISSYPPGYKENAGIFCHNNPWVSCAETVVGHGDRAFEIYKKTCPAYIEDISEIHRTEPYVYSQMVAGCDAATFGEAKNSWLTGTAAWTFVDVSQYILGIQPTLAGLKIDPCIPHEMDGFTLRRVWRGATYEIVVENPDHVEKGVKTMTVDGKQLNINFLLPAPVGSTVQVLVTMG